MNVRNKSWQESTVSKLLVAALNTFVTSRHFSLDSFQQKLTKEMLSRTDVALKGLLFRCAYVLSRQVGLVILGEIMVFFIKS